MNFLRFRSSHAFADDDTPTRGALFDSNDVAAHEPTVEAALAAIEDGRDRRPELSFLRLPYAYHPETGRDHFDGALASTLENIREIAAAIRDAGGTLIHVGIGGSALGASLLCDALGDDRPNVVVIDNVDPNRVARALAGVQPDRTWLHAVSRSGGTVETVANFAVVYDHLLRRGVPPEQLRDRVIVTTSPGAGPLAETARLSSFRTLPLPAEVGGRFSALAPGSLLAAAVAGVDLDGLLDGARTADAFTAGAPFDDNPVAQLAALHHLGSTRGRIRTLVLMPYVDRLRLLADWYSQLIAESLGKDGLGVTPVKALGATDQHSQLQLYNDGPKDKLVLFFTADDYGASLPIVDVFPRVDAYRHLTQHSLAELITAEQRGTAVSLKLNGAPSCAMHVDRVDARSTGAMLTCLQKTVCVLGELYGVNAFDQPGVEESKAYARAMLGMPGARFDALREQVAQIEAG